jgi:hypothetical protein
VKIQNGGSNMATEKIKIYSIVMKLGIWGFLESLNMNMRSKCEDLKWRIQYGDRKNQNLFDCYETRYPGVFRVAKYEFEVKM